MDVMYIAVDTYGVFAYFYFILLVLIGAFYVVNLFLAVLFDSYASGQAAAAAREEAAAATPRIPAPVRTRASRGARQLFGARPPGRRSPPGWSG